MHHIVVTITELATRLGHWGYLLIFLVVLLECQALFGLFVPGESLVLVSGFLAGQGVFDLDVLIVVVAAGAIAGDSLGYELGRRLGLDWLRRHGGRVGLREKHFAKIDHFLARHGGKSVFLSHFMHLLRAMMPFVAGAHRMPFARFFVFNAIGCVFWAATFTSIGFLVGESWPLVEKWIGRAGAVVGLLLVLFLALARCWSWLVQHEDEVRTWWQNFIARPRVAALRRKFAREIRFLEDRLTPGGYLGLHLTVGVIIVLLAGWRFGDIVEDLLARESLLTIDFRLADWFNAHGTPTLTHFAWAMTFMASGPFLTGATVLIAAVLAWRRMWYRFATLLLVVGGGSLLNVALKFLFQRPRPEVAHPLVTLSTYSFPSGHTMGATVFYGVLVVLILRARPRWAWRVLAPLLAVFMIVLVGLSRLYLGAHYLSDVLGAMCVGIMWLTSAATAVEINRRYRQRPRAAPRMETAANAGGWTRKV